MKWGRRGVLVVLILAGTFAAFVGASVNSAADLPMRQYEHRAGFRVPVPSEWTLTEDEEIEGFTIETVVTGPYHDGFTTNILIETDRDPTVRENNVYLRQLVDATLEGAPGASVSEGPTYRTIAGHAGVVFAATDSTSPPPIVQKFAIVVSEDHDRYWFLLLSVNTQYLALYNSTFDRMIDEFEITAQPATFGGIAVVGAIAAVAGIVAAMLIAIGLSRRRKPVPSVLSATPPPYTPAPPLTGGSRFCAACGTPAPAAYRFCVTCGSPIPQPAPAPESAPPTPPDSGTPQAPPPPP